MRGKRNMERGIFEGAEVVVDGEGSDEEVKLGNKAAERMRAY